MRRFFTLTAILLTLGAAGFAQAPVRPAPSPGGRATASPPASSFDRKAYEVPHQKFVLSNGLTLLVHEDHSVPIVGVNLWYHVGSRNEQRGRTGLAHLFEHFFFNGSQNYPRGFREAMDDLGATNRNGTTNTDRTNFFEDVPVSALERTLYLEADRMGFLAAQINQAMLDRERGVVQNEKRQREDQPYGRAYGRIVERMYPAEHPYSWSTIGSMEDLNAASLDDVRAWYAGYYGPNNCVLSLAGDVTAERALALVKKYFDGIKPGPPVARLERWIPTLDADVREEMEERVPQTRVHRVYHAPAWRDADLEALELTASVLSGSRSARLDRRLINEQDLATTVTAYVSTNELASLFIVEATVKSGVDPGRVEDVIQRTVAEFTQQGPTEAELQRARTRALSAFSRGAERLGGFGGRSDILAQAMTFDGSPDGYLTHLERTSRATVQDVRQAARQWLAAPHYTLVVKPFPAVAATQTDLDRTLLPPLGPPPDVSFPAVQRATLSNGLKVVLLERHSTPLVNMTLAVDAGYASDSGDKAGAASLALDVLDEGTATRDSFQIVDDLDAIGAQITTGSSLDLSFVRLRTLTRSLRPSLDLYADVILRPAFPQAMFDLAKQRRLAQIGQEKAQPIALAQRVVPTIVYGADHAYGNPLTGSGFEPTVRALTRDDLVAWHRTWFHPASATLIVAGDATLATLVPELERVFGRWPQGTAPGKRIATVAPTRGGRVYLIDTPGAAQSVIVATHVSESGGLAEDLAIDTVMRNFGGLATSRLNRNLRLDKQWSYGTAGVLMDARGQRPFIIIAPVQADKTTESIIEVQKELRDIAAARPISGEEYASIMRVQTLGLPGRFATLAALEAAAVQLVNYRYADDYFATYALRARSVTEGDLAAAAARFIRPSEAVWIIVGDVAKIEAGIRGLNLGTVARIDGDGRPLASTGQ
jgi:zinc protease